jgi:hypothetical protein
MAGRWAESTDVAAEVEELAGGGVVEVSFGLFLVREGAVVLFQDLQNPGAFLIHGDIVGDVDGKDDDEKNQREAGERNGDEFPTDFLDH